MRAVPGVYQDLIVCVCFAFHLFGSVGSRGVLLTTGKKVNISQLNMNDLNYDMKGTTAITCVVQP